LRLSENFDSLNPAVNSYLDLAQPVFLQQIGDPVAAKQMALQTLDNLRTQQSSALAYFDTFFIFAVVAVALIALIFFMKRSVAEKGAQVAAEQIRFMDNKIRGLHHVTYVSSKERIAACRSPISCRPG
jgi:DHA2 family multidrug resistance protein